MPRQAVVVHGVPPALGPYSRAVWAGDFLYLAGLTGIDPDEGRLVPGGIAAEAEQALRNVAAVLASAALSMGDVVKVGNFLIEMSDFAEANSIYAQHFEAPVPARTTVAVAALPQGARIEINVIAMRPRLEARTL
ncbi:MAG: hypothetical protein H7Z19_12340 [Chitinophagaceae bacterium]|nr:hypothetical protein [Rubrivivax sp.]